MNRSYHEPVLATEAVNLLLTSANGIYIDATVGGGGHATRIAERLSDRGQLVGLDRDPDAISAATAALPSSSLLLWMPFSRLGELRKRFPTGVDGVLMDLGISSHQIDTPERGFSHRFSGPLDLRMDPTAGESAAELLARLPERELSQLMKDYGEESQARRIANFLVRAREQAALARTEDLERVISAAVPATRVKSLARVFQALRIAVNRELDELEQGLTGAFDLLRPGGRLVVISYHSLEDRIVKRFFGGLTSPRTPDLPFLLEPAARPGARSLTRKPVVAGDSELAQNVRARSAKLRAIEKIEVEE